MPTVKVPTTKSVFSRVKDGLIAGGLGGFATGLGGSVAGPIGTVIGGILAGAALPGEDGKIVVINAVQDAVAGMFLAGAEA